MGRWSLVVLVLAACAGESRVVGGGSNGGAAGRGGTDPLGGSGGASGIGGKGTGGGKAGVSGSGAMGAGVAGTSGEAGSGGANGGTGGDAGDAGDANAGTGGGVPIRGALGECESPDAYSPGLEACDGGFVHRPEALACDRPPRDPDYPNLVPDGGDIVVAGCTWDADCDANEYCIVGYSEREECSVHTYECRPSCQVDQDCPSGTVCGCERVRRAATQEEVELGTCMPAECATDGDCPDGALCTATLDNPRPHTVIRWSALTEAGGFRCQAESDECWRAGTCPGVPIDEDNERCSEPTCEAVDGVMTCGLRGTCSDVPECDP